jgi:hypothetical protein
VNECPQTYLRQARADPLLQIPQIRDTGSLRVSSNLVEVSDEQGSWLLWHRGSPLSVVPGSFMLTMRQRESEKSHGPHCEVGDVRKVTRGKIERARRPFKGSAIVERHKVSLLSSKQRSSVPAVQHSNLCGSNECRRIPVRATAISPLVSAAAAPQKPPARAKKSRWMTGHRQVRLDPAP